ncbi:hypothetical protein DVA86_22225 [Streptomyces armeniacus]|uniref:ATP-binding protein n=1 Tax=Streptomyces armeniacus TaxID=83291 RepID=A0A345XTI8_9ACTN|nr:hypothetical protein [Streptomyces armeniacus]AXK34954.1 hypothetical protein DVA86_22225 [Streptomyces armeniacus]
MPYQLPPEPPHFVDRDDEQARAFRAVAEWGERSRPLCLALNGLGGAGKTELAFRIARGLRDRYPDGVLYEDLDDYRRDGAVETADVLGQLLRALGVPSELLAPSFAARRKQWWELTEQKRLAVVIDNARYGTEVLPLLPASGASLAIVVSHGPLYDLESGAAIELPLSPLDEPYVADLLRRVADDGRLAAEPDAADGLVRLCSGLPAAVHVAGRWIRRHHIRPLSRLLGELTAEFDEQGLPVVEKVWDAAYRSLGPDAARLYRLLATAPGSGVGREGAAALLGRGQDPADTALEELDGAGLLVWRERRIRLPDLLRAHARRRAREDGGETEAADGRRRALRWILRQAQRADVTAAGPRMTLAAEEPPQQGAPDVPFAGKAGAVRWLEAERHALFDSVRTAYAYGLDAEAWALCEPLWTLFLDHPHYADVIDAFRTGLAAAQRAGHPRAALRMRCMLARPLWEQGLLDDAEREVEQALDAVRALAVPEEQPVRALDRKLGASALEARGMLRTARGQWAEAAADFDASRRVHEEIGNAYGALLQTYRLGEAMAALGELTRAAELLTRAHASAADQGRARMTARTGLALGGVRQRLGHHGAARALYEASLAGARERGSEREELRSLDALTALAEETGDAAGAAAHRAAAQTVRARNGLAGATE